MKISGSRIDLENGRIDNAVLKNYGETLVGGISGASSSTAYTVDISAGNVFHILMNGNCTFTFSNPTPAGTTCYFTLLLKQDGASRTATWPSTVTWAGGSAPTLATAGGAHDIISFITTDGGSSYIGFVGGQSFPPEPAPTLYNMFAWGRNDYGNLGDRTLTHQSNPIQVGTLSSWSSAMITGSTQYSSAVVRSDNTLWSWGKNQQGQLGLSDAISRSSPVQVGGLINWSSVTGSFGMTAIKTDGTLWSWGYNGDGGLGQRDIVSRSSPTQIGTLTTWANIKAGNYSALAVKTDGTLWVWGRNAYGLLGLGDTIKRSSPTQLGTLATWASAASTSVANSMAIKTDGTLWAWGRNNSAGALGLGDAIDRSSPVQVGTLTTWSKVALVGAGAAAMAIKTDGTLWSWGPNSNGNTGSSDTVSRSSPTQVGTLTNWSNVATFWSGAGAVRTDGTLWTWGSNSRFALGLGDNIQRSSPTQVGGGAGWVSIGFGIYHALAMQDPSLLASGALFGWGSNTQGTHGVGDIIYRSSPVQVGAENMWSDVSSRPNFSIALKSDGTMWSWGYSGIGQLGLGDAVSRSSPTQVGPMLPGAKAWTSIASSPGFASAIATRADGTLWVWGQNNKGQLGLGDTYNGPGPNAAARSSPTQVGTLTTWVPGPGASGNSKHVIKTDGTLWVWGYNKHGQLGTGDSGAGADWQTSRSSPVQVGTLGTWAKATTGQYHPLILATDGTLWGMGYNAFGQLGIGVVTHRSSPTQIGTLTWRAIASGGISVAVRSDNTLWTWGPNNYGQLGLGDRGAGAATSRSSPTQVGTLATWAAAAVDAGTVAALKTDGTMWTWGNNAQGGLGQQDRVLRSSPTQVGTLATWTRLTTGGVRALGILWTGTASAPSAPLNVVAVAGAASGTVVVSFTPPVKSGSKPITQYTVTSSPGSIIATGSNNVILVTGLTNNTPYTFTITATNAVGTSSASAKSNVVTPPVQGGAWVWGGGADGKLGLENTVSVSSPTQLGASTNWTQMAEAHRANGGIKTDGTLWMWGRSYYGSLGLGDNISRSSPTQMGTLTNWSKLVLGNDFGVAIKTDNTLWAWGSNSYGKFGRGNTVSTSSPVQVGTLATWRSVGIGRYNVFGIQTDGTLWAAGGAGSYGTHGLGDTIARSSMVQVGTLATWSKITGNVYGTHMFGLQTTGTIWSWGRNIYGRLGNGLIFTNGGNRSSPSQIGTLSDWADIAATGSSYHTLALKTDSTLWAWGNNGRGGLGIGNRIDRSSPVQVGTLGTWASLAVGRTASAAIKIDGTLWSWGRNFDGELGSGNTVYRSSPVQVGTLATWQQVRGGFSRFDAIR